ncbi:hypothetical protein QCE73_38070 [Caballeronia sp. LZ029]|uniref:hypothetical protein n=1 Tax=Caballeronia sp. LZ029 TaxID=3038564 RepID=UPI002857F20B|nr:hypothetical protein [Caballeronia sp. LZ029]MDR5748975.1 hypothetical protein [Caballeronia sp. LZ029]
MPFSRARSCRPAGGKARPNSPTSSLPGNPLISRFNTRLKEAIDRIREASSGRLAIRVFPASQLGSDTDLLSQTRSGAVEFLNIARSRDW